MNKIQFLFEINLYFLMFTIALTCPYQEYQTSILPEKQFQQIKAFIISDEDNVSSFGFWSFSIPLMKYQNIQEIKIENQSDSYISQLDENGQLFFFLYSNLRPENNMIGYLEIDQFLGTVKHKYIVTFDSVQQFFEFSYQPLDYEGIWFYQQINFKRKTNEIIIENSGQQFINTEIFLLDDNFQIILGGRGFFLFQYNLDNYKGKLSKLYIQSNLEWNENQIDDFYQNCKIPQIITGKQTIMLIEGMHYFYGNEILQKNLLQIGNRYCLSGWFKLDFSQVVNRKNFIIIRMTAFQNYFFNNYMGDELFYLDVQIDTQYPSNTRLNLIVNNYKVPKTGLLDRGEEINVSSYVGYSLNEKIFDSLQKWHFIQYEYGRDNEEFSNERMLMKINFFENSQIIVIRPALTEYQGSFTNSQFYFYIGGDELAIDLLQAQIYDLKFEYNYDQNQEFFQSRCHYSCLDCNGPLQNNCLTCDLNANRFYLADQFRCPCLLDYQEIGNLCINSFQYFKSIKLQNILTQTNSICQSGYFNFINSNNEIQCIKCPQSNSIDILCVDCLYYPFTWYLKPICTMDMIAQTGNNDDAFTITNRPIENYDFYFINDIGTLNYHQGFQDFCNFEIDKDCYKVKYQHLNQFIYIKCKQNYFYIDGDCISTIKYCKNYNSNMECIECQEGMYLQNNQCLNCPQICPNCFYNNQKQQINCLSCQVTYTLINGECYKCGNNCQICQNYYDDNIEKYYLKCLTCIDNSKYYLSFDAINCVFNDISKCKYAFQALKNNFNINTLDYTFIPQYDSNNIQTYCGRCEDNHIFLLSTFTCIKAATIFCDFAYADSIISRPFFFPFYQAIVNDKMVFTTEQFCLIENTYSLGAVQFQSACSSMMMNCETCLLGRTLSNYQCLKCKSGYYSELLTGKCLTCPSQLNCFQCYQRNKYNHDEWKIYIRAFYKNFIENQDSHLYTIYGLSQNIEDYEIICSLCEKGYELKNNICIKKCPENCLECKYINGQNQCIKCQMEIQGRRQSIYNNECTECQLNCALCRQRSNEEIKLINPLFQNLNYIKYSNQCLKSFQDQQYYFDQQIGLFVQCENQQNQCEHQVKIPIILYCETQQYLDILNTFDNIDAKLNFQQENILITDLYSENSFPQFQNDNFYLIANQRIIKSIIIEITTKFEQQCEINGNATISQLFSQNIFSAINVELEMNFKYKTEFFIEKSLAFSNFNKIMISGLNIIPLQNGKYKEIKFYAQFYFKLFLNQIKYQQQDRQLSDQSKITLSNVSELTINNSQFYDLNLLNVENFIYYETDLKYKQLTFENIKIINSNLINSTFLLINSNSDDLINLKQIYIETIFDQSFFIRQTQKSQFNKNEIQQGTIQLLDLKLNIIVLNQLQLFNLNQFIYVQLINISITDSKIIESNIFLLNNNCSIRQLNITNNLLQNSSKIIMNSDNFSINLNYQFTQIMFSYNQYTLDCAFIQLQRFLTNEQRLDFSFLEIIANQLLIDNQFQPNLYQTYEISLIYLYTKQCQLIIILNEILIDNLIIKRGFGLVDLSIKQSKYIKIINSFITQEQNYEFLGIHQYYDCMIKKLLGLYYIQSIQIYSSQQLEIENLTIYKCRLLNSPIIQYQSADQKQIIQDENFILKNIIVKQNLVILNLQSMNLGLFQINSNQKSKILIQNIDFNQNIMHAYQEDTSKQSALLLNINTNQGNVTIIDSNFQKNSIYNSTFPIIYISSDIITINQSIFKYNNIFNYETIQLFLLWGFTKQDQIDQQILEQIFKIKTQCGNGYLKSASIFIQNSLILESKGNNGAGFYLESIKKSTIFINNVIFQNVSTNFLTKEQYGGALFIDSTLAEQLYFQCSDIQINFALSRYKGGFLYLVAGSSKVFIQLNNIISSNTYSLQGSFIFIDFATLTEQQQEIQISNIFINNSISEFLNYLDIFTEIQISEYQLLTYNRTIIQIESSSSIKIVNITYNNLYQESALFLNFPQKIIIQDVNINNCILSSTLIKIISNKYSINNYQLINIQGQGINFSNTIYLLNKNNCEQYKESFTNSFKCLLNNEQSPKQLNSSNIVRNQTANCILQEIQNQITKGQNQYGILEIQNIKPQDKILLNQIQLKEINCQICQQGLILLQLIEDLLQITKIKSLTIMNSNCGDSGCLVLEKQFENNRLLQPDDFKEQKLIQMQFEFLIENYICMNNSAYQATCLFINDIKLILQFSRMINNIAQSIGGAILLKNKKQILILNCIIYNNTAQTGGGLYFIDQLQTNYSILQTSINNNTALFYGNDVGSAPSQLSLTLSSNAQFFNKTSIINLQQQITEQINVSFYKTINGEITNTIMLPSGQAINKYQYFNWQQRKYISFNQNFRIIALSQTKEIIKNLNNTYCEIQSRIFDIEKQEQGQENFTTKNININKVFFDNITQTYNLDDLIVYFDSNSTTNLFLQLQIQCNSIIIPIYNTNFPYNIIETHNNYYLRVNIRTFQCQFGEIKNEDDGSCKLCQSELGQFALQLNQKVCSQKDDVSTINVKSAQLQLKNGYWRPFFDTQSISYCKNLPANCIGGWIEGDVSCFTGHIGALCEQCDIYNIRGDGEFSLLKQYSCASCLEKSRNSVIIIFVTLWTLISTFISVQSSIKTTQEKSHKITVIKLGLGFAEDLNQSSILIKLLMNYLQIIGFISTFQLQFPENFLNFINGASSPNQAMVYSLDCFLSQLFQFEIHYSRMVWSIILPFIYISVFLLLFFIGTQFNFFQFNRNIIITCLLYIYIYLQPSLIGGFIQLSSYREISGFKWISANVAQRYDTLQHYEWVLKFCLPFIIILAILIPLFLFYSIYKNRNKLDIRLIRDCWGYLYNEYTSIAYFWEIVKILQKELIIIFLIYFEENIVIKATLMLLILFFYLQLNQIYKPYKQSLLNKLDYLSIYICSISICLAIGVYVALETDFLEITIPYFIIMGTINLYFLIKIIEKIVLEMIKEKSNAYQQKLDYFRDQIKKQFPNLKKYTWLKHLLQNRTQQLERIKKRIQKLKRYLLFKARQIIQIKNAEFMQNNERLTEKPIDLHTISLQSSARLIGYQNKSIKESQMINSNSASPIFSIDRDLSKQKQIEDYMKESYLKQDSVQISFSVKPQQSKQQD